MFKKITGKDYVNYKLNNVYKINNNPFCNYIIYEEKKIILGFIIYSLIYERAEIEYIYVDKNYRRNHIGTKLINYMEKNAISNKCTNITLEVSIKNTEAYNLYLKNGFIEVATREKYYNGVDALLMLKKLGD